MFKKDIAIPSPLTSLEDFRKECVAHVSIANYDLASRLILRMRQMFDRDQLFPVLWYMKDITIAQNISLLTRVSEKLFDEDVIPLFELTATGSVYPFGLALVNYGTEKDIELFLERFLRLKSKIYMMDILEHPLMLQRSEIMKSISTRLFSRIEDTIYEDKPWIKVLILYLICLPITAECSITLTRPIIRNMINFLKEADPEDPLWEGLSFHMSHPTSVLYRAVNIGISKSLNIFPEVFGESFTVQIEKIILNKQVYLERQSISEMKAVETSKSKEIEPEELRHRKGYCYDH